MNTEMIIDEAIGCDNLIDFVKGLTTNAIFAVKPQEPMELSNTGIEIFCNCDMVDDTHASNIKITKILISDGKMYNIYAQGKLEDVKTLGYPVEIEEVSSDNVYSIRNTSLLNASECEEKLSEIRAKL